MADNLYLSKFQVGSQEYLLKDAEAREQIAQLKQIKGINYIGATDGYTYAEDAETTDPVAITDLVTLVEDTTDVAGAHIKIGDVKYYVVGTGNQKVLKNGDLITVKKTIGGVQREMEYVITVEGVATVTATFHEFGSTGVLGTLAFKDQATVSGTAASHTHTYDKAVIDKELSLTQGTVTSTGTFTPSGSNGSSTVTFTEGAGSDFVTGYNNDAVAPTFTEGAFSAGTLPSYTEGAFSAGTLPSFTEGAFTPASLSEGFVTAGSAASYSHSGFDGGSLGSATTSAFATEGLVATADASTETLTFTSASTSNAVTAQGTFTPATYGTDTFDGGTPTSIDVTKFSGGSKASDTFSAGTLPSKTADTFSAGTLPSKAADTFTAGSAATLAKAKALTASVTGTAAAQTFTGTEGNISVSGTSNTTISQNVTLKYTTENSGSTGAAVTGTAE